MRRKGILKVDNDLVVLGEIYVGIGREILNLILNLVGSSIWIVI